MASIESYSVANHDEIVIIVLTRSLQVTTCSIEYSLVEWNRVLASCLSLGVVVNVVSHEHEVAIKKVNDLCAIFVLH